MPPLPKHGVAVRSSSSRAGTGSNYAGATRFAYVFKTDPEMLKKSRKFPEGVKCLESMAFIHNIRKKSRVAREAHKNDRTLDHRDGLTWKHGGRCCQVFMVKSVLIGRRTLEKNIFGCALLCACCRLVRLVVLFPGS